MRGRKPRIGERYMQALSALYGNAKAPITSKLPKSEKLVVATEESEQIRLVGWLLEKGIRHYHIPNGRSSLGENLKAMRMGQSSGVPDLCIPIPARGFHGLYVELKRTRGGVVSPAQEEWLQWLNSHGHKACVARGFEEGKKIVMEYFGWIGE